MAHLFDENKGKKDFDALIQPKLDALQTAFQNNVNLIYDAIVNAGVTPTGKTPSEIATGINDIQAITWSERIITGDSLSPIYLSLPYKNAVSLHVNGVSGDGYINGTPVVSGSIYYFQSNTSQFVAEAREPSEAFIGEYKIDMTVVYQAKILR